MLMGLDMLPKKSKTSFIVKFTVYEKAENKQVNT